MHFMGLYNIFKAEGTYNNGHNYYNLFKCIETMNCTT